MRLAMMVLVAVVSFAPVPSATAQCAMCRTALEGSEAGQAMAGKLNRGILFLLAAPFGVVTGIGVAMFRSRRRRKFVG